LLAAVHLDEAEALRAARVPVHDDLRRWTVPCEPNRVCRSLSVVPYDRLPTYNFLPTRGLLRNESRKTGQAHSGLMPSHESASVVGLGRAKGRWEG
jgi:hypothetical protein